MHVINGIAVKSAGVFAEGPFWRWRVIDAHGTEYLDGGNYSSREQAERGLDNAYDPPKNAQASKLRKLIADRGYTQRGAAKELQISERMMRYYCSGKQPIPHVVMLAIEHLVNCQK